MTLRADLFWSFGSPYSHLALMRWRQIVRDYDVLINLRPVYPPAMRQDGLAERRHPNHLRYVNLDSRRIADRMGVVLVLPRPDPLDQRGRDGVGDASQPLMRRLVRTCQAAARRGRGFDYADAVSQLIWSGIERWNSDHHLSAAVSHIGLDLSVLDGEADADPAGLDRDIAANQAVLEESGHWGVPTLIFRGEPFFGQDHIDMAMWRMERAGLARRR